MKIHIVKQGDTLYALSQKYGVPLQKIIEANPQISNPEALNVGDKVKIPAAPASVPESSELFISIQSSKGIPSGNYLRPGALRLKKSLMPIRSSKIRMHS